MYETEQLNTRISAYWSKRSKGFAETRRMELKDHISQRWLAEMKQYLPGQTGARILDVGTGTGYFAILLSACGYQVSAVDLTAAMIDEARLLAEQYGAAVDFRRMDAQQLAYCGESFDAVVTRNLTWTLPDLSGAYREWFRVLKPGGVLLNFDADYGREVITQIPPDEAALPVTAYSHIGMTEELIRESNAITRMVSADKQNRPELDIRLMQAAGFQACRCDRDAGTRILAERNGAAAPLFLLTGRKPT